MGASLWRVVAFLLSSVLLVGLQSAVPVQAAAPGAAQPSSPSGETVRWQPDPRAPIPFNASVVEAQRILRSLGYYFGAVDGRLGRQTANALVWFQQVNRIPDHGDLDARTFARLRTTPVGVPQGVPAEAVRLAQSPQCRGKKVVYASVQTYRMLYAFENGRLVRQLPVRPGGIALGHDGLLHRYGTAVGVTRQVWTKHPVTDLGGWGAMPYALRTTPYSYAFIHQAVGSSHPNANGHGCLNVLTGAPWLYNWAPAGLPVVYAA